MYLLLLSLFLACGFWLYRIWKLKTSVNKYARYWRKEQNATGEITLVALGDSAAQGIGATRPELGYVGLLRKRLEVKTGKTVRVINISQSGAKVADVLKVQIPQLKNQLADYVIVGIGGNDIYSYDRVQFQKSVSKLMAELPKHSVISDIPYFMHGKWEVNALNAAKIMRISAKANGITIAHLHNAMKCKGWKAMFKNFAADWFHPSNTGHQIWADAFWSAIMTSKKSDSS